LICIVSIAYALLSLDEQTEYVILIVPTAYLSLPPNKRIETVILLNSNIPRLKLSIHIRIDNTYGV